MQLNILEKEDDLEKKFMLLQETWNPTLILRFTADCTLILLDLADGTNLGFWIEGLSLLLQMLYLK